MPSPMRAIEERHWNVRLPKWSFVVAVDASQDLLVVCSPPGTLRILSLSTGEGHLSATVSEISLRNEYMVRHAEVFSEYCAVLYVWRRDACVRIWNWRTGDNEIELPQSKFTFLSSTHIAILPDQSEAILVYSFIRTEKAPPPPTVFVLPTSVPRTFVSLRPCSDVGHAVLFRPAQASLLYPRPRSSRTSPRQRRFRGHSGALRVARSGDVIWGRRHRTAQGLARCAWLCRARVARCASVASRRMRSRTTAAHASCAGRAGSWWRRLRRPGAPGG
ncbi:hypothetical protein FA95DRAFT_1014467 [Auriscalpium vulgare]|uniref:Uncharacterized protein n=1 Tax=Auriscalpium vulgare TaxID=40419 RepID=A0ACB8RXV1_9AGAM|nr:hypothetical protein FA95DRAFT_1014467 [Auriscalpium vulgare]